MFNIADIEELVDMLNTTLWDLDRNYKVFDGKCCFISYVIARNLEEKNINFDVIGYAHVKTNEGSIQQFAREGELAHVTIRISAGNKKFIIGENIIDSKGLTLYAQKMSAYELMDMYEKNNWNDGHQDISDKEIESTIDDVFIYV